MAFNVRESHRQPGATMPVTGVRSAPDPLRAARRPSNLSPHAQELARRIAEIVAEYESDHPDLAHHERQQAFQIAALENLGPKLTIVLGALAVAAAITGFLLSRFIGGSAP